VTAGRRRLAGALLLLAALGGGCRRGAPPPSVILVSIDTLRPDHLGCYGYGRPTSPEIDRFRAEAVLFEQAIAHAPSTLPSHASILTSLVPAHHGASVANGLAVPLEALTLAEVLRERGYATASFNGGIQLDRAWGLDQGFDRYVSVKPRDASAESLVDPTDRFAHVVDEAARWLSGQEGRPVFLFLHTYEVHHPYSPEAADLALFRGDYRGPLPDQVSVDLLKRINDGAQAVDARDRRHVVAAYDAEIRSMDRAFGRLRARLEERGRYEDALVVFTSDHGEEFGEHGRMGWHTHSLHDELLRVPLLVKLPKARLAGASLGGQARGIDVAPTLLAALGIAAPAAFEGRNLLADRPLMGEGTETLAARDVKEPNRSAAIRTLEWKLYDGRLFDLRRDAGETRDVAAGESAVVERLRGRERVLLGARPAPPRRPAAQTDELRERLRSHGYVA
jgi:arylsulfatase A-like enzyme